ncbi:MAG TPA: CDGSH iron-sulfur domain-containing protein [Candidatus Binatia bacterium]|nr:CDGSH iron-sulfur domain-containing protein [Candidatus Binatia bacterium]
MGQVQIKPLKDGPYQVVGTVGLVGPDGQVEPAAEDPIFLCRCGQSATKPFCDGTHKRVGFRAEGWVRPPSRAGHS